MADYRRPGSSRYQLILEQAQKLPFAYLTCRMYNHKWSDKAVREAIDARSYRLWNYCERCEGENWKEWTLRGRQLAAGIRYPDNYLFHDTGILDTADRNILRMVYAALLPEA